METSFGELRKVQLNEKRSGTLTVLEEDFFAAYRDLVARQKADLCASFSLEGARAFENTSKLLREVGELRQSKILLKAFRDLRAGTVDAQGLAREEKGLYTSLVKLLKEYDECLVGQTASGSSAAVCEPAANVLRIRFLADVAEAFVASDGRECGPFSANQVVELSPEDASMLVRRKVAEFVDAEKQEARKRVVAITEGVVEPEKKLIPDSAAAVESVENSQGEKQGI